MALHGVCVSECESNQCSSNLAHHSMAYILWESVSATGDQRP